MDLFILKTLLFLSFLTVSFAKYDPNEGLLCAKLTEAAYCAGYNKVADWSCNVCKQIPEFQNATLLVSIDRFTRGFFAYDSLRKRIVISFAGTDPLDIRNWIDDLDFLKTSYPNNHGYVHGGFYKTYLAVKAQVMNLAQLYKASFPNSPFVITGHSLGGALATHCALDLRLTLGITPESVYTFGEPRAGDETFANFYTSNIANHFRVTHNYDPVPHLPPQSFGFEHSVQEIYYPGGLTYYIECQGPEDGTCSNKHILDLSIPDHLTYMGLDYVSAYLGCKLSNNGSNTTHL